MSLVITRREKRGVTHTIDVYHKLKRANANQGDKKGPSNDFFRAHHANFKSDKAETTSSSYSLTVEQYHDLSELIVQTKSISVVNQVSIVSNISGIPPISLIYDKGLQWILTQEPLITWFVPLIFSPVVYLSPIVMFIYQTMLSLKSHIHGQFIFQVH